MSNQMNIIAALCAKANDAAFANEISIAADRFQGQEDPAYDEDNPVEFIATLCVKAANFHLEDHHLNPAMSEAPKELICPSVAYNGHKISNMHPESLPSMLSTFDSASTDEDYSRRDELSRHQRSKPSCNASVGEESSASSLTEVERRPVRRDVKQRNDVVVPKPDNGLATRKPKRRSSRADSYAADMVTAALACCHDDAPEKHLGTRPGSRRTGGFGVVPIAQDSPRRMIGIRRSSHSLRQKLDIPKGTFDGSTHSPAGEEIATTEEPESNTIPSDDELKAIGWKKALDAASGNYYYYTVDRSKVVWENPLIQES